MKLAKSHTKLYMCGVAAAVVTLLFAGFADKIPATFAEGNTLKSISEAHYVTIHDGDSKLTVKTHAVTVAEALERAGFALEETDTIEPSRTELITSDNFHINIYRSRPVIVKDGFISKYLMTSSYDPKTIAESAGFSIYDGDVVEASESVNFLETGGATTYEITRNGGQTITIEEELAYEEQTQEDESLPAGETKIIQDGEYGKRIVRYIINFVDGEEISRDLISDEITKAPVAKITAIGTGASTSSTGTGYRSDFYTSRPDWQTCEAWARAAGVSEADMDAALTLIYHESGCRVDAENAYSGAYGIPQALPGNKMASMGDDWQTNPVTQIRWMIQYVNNRYGGWQGALEFWWCTGTCRGIEKGGYWY